ncbi:MAG: M61 family metallopeptidase [Planctomycetes bacterium]|nr:M61 family metallopeptidase [Planctomycetota bacterium]
MTTRPRAILCLSWAAASAGLLPAQTSAEFRLRFAQGEEFARVTARYDGCDTERLELAMPAWKPGSYTIHEFGKSVAEIRATDDKGVELLVEANDVGSWHVHSKGTSTVIVEYALRTRASTGFGPGFSLGKGLGRPLREEKPAPVEPIGDPKPEAEAPPRRFGAYAFEGPATWLYVPGRLAIPHRVSFELPAEWDVATGLRRVAQDKLEFEAPDYDVFADCPFHVGVFEQRSFELDGARYEIVWSGFEHDRHDRDAFASRYRTMVRAHHAMWGKPPFDRYVFLIAFPGGGGLEHLNSCDMGMMDLSGSEPGKPSAWDSLASHEFFHAWNVKRLRPKALGPFDYSGPNRTRFLWLSEGVTSYYGDLLLVRAGIWDAEHFWTGAIADEIRALQNNPGRLKMSIAEASWTVWDAPYMRRGRTAPDYYNKGMLLGLLLDVEIRDASDGKRSLDDVMRAVYELCMQEGRGFEDGEFLAACTKAAGKPMDEFFARYVDGTDELPYAETLAKIGLRVLSPADQAPANKPEGEGKPEGKPEGEAESRPRARRSWRIEIDEKAKKSAVDLREAMTARLGD